VEEQPNFLTDHERKLHGIATRLREDLPDHRVDFRLGDRRILVTGPDGLHVGFLVWSSSKWRGWGSGQAAWDSQYKVGGYMGGGWRAVKESCPGRYVGRDGDTALVEDFVAWAKGLAVTNAVNRTSIPDALVAAASEELKRTAIKYL
jgi:hypothetical protein